VHLSAVLCACLGAVVLWALFVSCVFLSPFFFLVGVVLFDAVVPLFSVVFRSCLVACFVILVVRVCVLIAEGDLLSVCFTNYVFVVLLRLYIFGGWGAALHGPLGVHCGF
jgi:hypothetical protein